MSVNVTLDEIRLNATLAALYERKTKLTAELAVLRTQPESVDRDYAMDCVAMALQHTLLAVRELTVAIPDPEPLYAGAWG